MMHKATVLYGTSLAAFHLVVVWKEKKKERTMAKAITTKQLTIANKQQLPTARGDGILIFSWFYTPMHMHFELEQKQKDL
jgi:hypothetical protein